MLCVDRAYLCVCSTLLGSGQFFFHDGKLRLGLPNPLLRNIGTAANLFEAIFQNAFRRIQGVNMGFRRPQLFSSPLRKIVCASRGFRRAIFDAFEYFSRLIYEFKCRLAPRHGRRGWAFGVRHPYGRVDRHLTLRAIKFCDIIPYHRDLREKGLVTQFLILRNIYQLW